MKKYLLWTALLILGFVTPSFAVTYEEGSDFTELAAAPAANDWLVGLIDVSDTTDSAEGTSKKLLISYLFTSPIFTTSLRLQYDATNYLDVTILDDGHTTFTTVDPDGAEADINFAPDGNVGIKTVAPSTALEVTGTVTATAFAGPLTGAVTGNASTATALATTRAIGGVNFDGTAAITPTTIVVADTEDATTFVGLWDSATGSLLPKTDEQLTYVANTGILTAAGFAGSLASGTELPLTTGVTGILPVANGGTGLAALRHLSSQPHTASGNISEAQILASKFHTNYGAGAEIDLVLPDLEYFVSIVFIVNQAFIIEINPPNADAHEAFDLDNGAVLLDPSDCIDSPIIPGSKIVATRMMWTDGTWKWSFDTIRGAWTDGGASD